MKLEIICSRRLHDVTVSDIGDSLIIMQGPLSYIRAQLERLASLIERCHKICTSGKSEEENGKATRHSGDEEQQEHCQHGMPFLVLEFSV